MAATEFPKQLEPKDPDEIVPYTWNWARTLAQWEDTIDHATVVCEDVTITLSDLAVSTTLVKQTTEDGIHGRTYKLICDVFTAGGLHLQRPIWVKCKSR